jgi:glycosyl transferase family 4
MTDVLNILHVLRAPVGGLFRHVCDLARGQAARGHRVGVVADAASGGDRADAALADLAPALALGLTRVPMTRNIGGGDLAAIRHVGQRATELGVDVLHGHGAKGGAYARLAPACTTAGARPPDCSTSRPRTC